MTTDFRHEFEVETRDLLRARFLWFTGTVGSISLVMLGIVLLSAAFGPPEEIVSSVRSLGWRMVLGILSTLLYLVFFVTAARGRFSHDRMLALTFWLVVIDGLFHQFAASVIDIGFPPLLGMFITHILACCFLPWTPRQAIQPLVFLVIVNALRVIALPTDLGLGGKLVHIGFSPLIGAPGVFICWLRHSRRLDQFRVRSMQRVYGQMKRELVDARRIHESLFPPQMLAGPLVFRYTYEPMRQIGGDYLYARALPTADGNGIAAYNIVVMDVTGHGVPAALTVNRLHGELERVFAENPSSAPGDVLALLNRYVHLTLANHSVYVTALCMKVHLAEDRLEYASGGHPPAFMRGVNGTLERLDPTTFVLGACGHEEFDATPMSVPFRPGDTVIAYTDGASEARNEKGRMLGTAGMERLVASCKVGPDNAVTGPRGVTSWAEQVLELVARHRFGPVSDDTLIIELTRPIVADAPVSPAQSGRRREVARG